jgi:hypothetical protein
MRKEGGPEFKTRHAPCPLENAPDEVAASSPSLPPRRTHDREAATSPACTGLVRGIGKEGDMPDELAEKPRASRREAHGTGSRGHDAGGCSLHENVGGRALRKRKHEKSVGRIKMAKWHGLRPAPDPFGVGGSQIGRERPESAS